MKVEKKFKIFLEIKKESQTFATRNEERERGDKLTKGVNTLLESDLSKSSLTEW